MLDHPTSNDPYLIEKVLATLRPFIEADGGGIEFVSLENNVVYVRMLGACIGCPASSFTQKMVIEQHIKQALPHISKVEVVD